MGCNSFKKRIKRSSFAREARDALREHFFTDPTAALAVPFLNTLNNLFSVHDDALTPEYFQRFIDRAHLILHGNPGSDEDHDVEARSYILRHCELLSENCEGFDEFAGEYFLNLFGYNWKKIILKACGRCG